MLKLKKRKRKKGRKEEKVEWLLLRFKHNSPINDILIQSLYLKITGSVKISQFKNSPVNSTLNMHIKSALKKKEDILIFSSISKLALCLQGNC